MCFSLRSRHQNRLESLQMSCWLQGNDIFAVGLFVAADNTRRSRSQRHHQDSISTSNGVDRQSWRAGHQQSTGQTTAGLSIRDLSRWIMRLSLQWVVPEILHRLTVEACAEKWSYLRGVLLVAVCCSLTHYLAKVSILTWRPMRWWENYNMN